MKSKKVIALLISTVLAFSVMLTGCKSSVSQGADKEQYLNMLLPADVKTLDLSKATDGYSKDILAEVYEGLTRMENDGKKDNVVAAGAEKWETSQDGTVWTFHLRDYKWTDGKPVTAKDYVYSWLRLLDPKTASDYAYFIYIVKGAEAYNMGKGKAEDVGLKALDDKTFQVILEKPVPYFILLTSFANLYPLRQDSVEAGGEQYGQDPAAVITNGPFKIEQWVKGSKVILKKSDSYWDAKSVKLQTATYHVVKEEAPNMQMFENKQLDATGARGEYKERFAERAKKGEIEYRTGFLPATSYIFFNVNDNSKLFTNAKVRLAFSLALDRDTFVKQVVKRAVPAYGWAPFSLLNGDKIFRDQVQEPLKELKGKEPKALFQEGLKELGMDPNGIYEVTYLQSSTSAVARTYGEFYQNQWQTKLGVKVKLDSVNDFPQFIDRVDRLEYQIGGMNWSGDYNDPMTFFDMFTTGNGNNPGKWSNAKYDELIKQVTSEMDYSKRLEIFKECEKLLLVDEAAIAPTMYSDKNTFIQKYVRNLQQPMFGPDYEIKYAYTEGRQ